MLSSKWEDGATEPVDVKGDKQRNRLQKVNKVMFMHTFTFLLYFFVYLLLRQQVSTNSIAPSTPLQTNATHHSSIHSDEGPMLETSAHLFQTSYVGKI